MKIYRICAALIVLLLFALPVAAQEVRSSGEQTLDAVISAGPASLSGVLLFTDGTNNASIVVYDGTSSVGRVVYKTTAEGDWYTRAKSWFPPLDMRTGIYVDVTGTGASYAIEYISK